jgi:hypothetical protein
MHDKKIYEKKMSKKVLIDFILWINTHKIQISDKLANKIRMLISTYKEKTINYDEIYNINYEIDVLTSPTFDKTLILLWKKYIALYSEERKNKSLPYTPSFTIETGIVPLANNVAKKYISSICAKEKLEGQCIIDEWLNSVFTVCYMSVKDRIITSFALLHKTDFPDETVYYANFILDFIYTFPTYRRQGFALSLLNKLKEDKFSLLTFVESSYPLLLKADFSIIKTHQENGREIKICINY